MSETHTVLTRTVPPPPRQKTRLLILIAWISRIRVYVVIINYNTSKQKWYTSAKNYFLLPHEDERSCTWSGGIYSRFFPWKACRLVVFWLPHCWWWKGWVSSDVAAGVEYCDAFRALAVVCPPATPAVWSSCDGDKDRRARHVLEKDSVSCLHIR